MARRYALIGGSPLMAESQAQASALEARLGVPVRVAGRLWHPYPEQVLRELAAAGARRVLSLPLAPQSVDVYHGAVREAAARLPELELLTAPAWGTEPAVVDALVETVDEGLASAARTWGGSIDASRTPVVLSAHSLPMRVLASGDRYEVDFRAMAALVAERLAARGHSVEVAFQSQGASNEAWLGPDLRATFELLLKRGFDRVLVAPVGFVAEHVETLYDPEGLSEYETIVRRPEWQREEDPQLFAALKKGRVPALAGFNRAFTHVDSVEDVTMAYYAASQIIVFMVDTYGFDKVVSMLPLWGKGQRTPEVIKTALGVTPADVDKAYRAWLDVRYARYKNQYVPDLHAPNLEDAQEAAKKAPADAKKQVELAIAFIRSGKMPQANAALEQALKLDPNQADALYVLADLALDAEKGEEKTRAEEARKLLDRLIAAKHDGYSVRMKMAGIALAVDDHAGARSAYESALQHDPTQAEPVAGLIKLHRKLQDGRSEIAALKKYVLLEQHDRGAWGRLLEGLVERNEWEEAVKVGESALYIDVGNPEIHRLYARALASTGRPVSAIFEYNSALIAGAPPEMAVGIYDELAKGYDSLKKPELAAKAREYKAKVETRAGEKKGRGEKEPRGPSI